MGPRSPEIEQFSKEHLPEERQQAASDIREKRREYFENKGELSEQVEELESLAEKKELTSQETREQIDRIQEELSQKEKNLLSRVANFLEIRKLRQDLGAKKEQLQATDEDFAETCEILDDFNQSLEDRSKLREAKDRLNEFYDEEEKAWQEYREEEEQRDLAGVMEKHGVFCVHCLDPSWVPKDNSVLSEKATWEQKFKLTLALEPEVSTSTLQAGKEQTLWSYTGLFLKGGRIEMAGSSDLDTIVSRQTGKRWTNATLGERIEEDIEEAITKRKDDQYNELVISEPQVAGAFFDLRENPSPQKEPQAFHKMLFETCQKIGVPFYVLEDGQVFEGSYDYDSNVFVKKGEPISRQEITQNDFSLDAETRDNLLQEAIESDAFSAEKMEIKEAFSFENYSLGQRTYLDIVGAVDPQKLIDKISESAKPDEGRPGVINAYGADTTERYFYENGQLFTQIKDANGSVRTRRFSPNKLLARGTVRTESGTASFSEPVTSLESYLKGAQSKTKEYQDEDLPEVVESLGYHMLGFAEMARKFGDDDIADRAEKIAFQYVSEDEYRKFREERFRPDGRFRLMKKDIPGFKERQKDEK